MNIPVQSSDLDAALHARGPGAYVLTVTDRGTPHVTHADVVMAGDVLSAQVGAHTADHARRRPQVSLLYPAREPADYSLILDAVATVHTTPEGPRLLLVPTRAVLHRSGPAADPSTSGCGADCKPLTLSHRPE